MDLREYTYITYRPDTFPRSTLESIRGVLSGMQSDCVFMIDKILNDGYIKPPPDYKWHGCYKIILSKEEIKAVLDGLIKAQNIFEHASSLTNNERHYLKQYVSYWSRILTEAPKSYDEYKSKQAYYDLRDISFEGFLGFIFEHEVVDERKEEKPWYLQGDIWVDWDKGQVTNLFIELFHKADKLLTIFSKDKLEQGFWAVMGPNLKCSAYCLIHDDELDVNLKEKLIYSMYFLYEKLFAKEPLETASNMWWDSLAYDFYESGPRDPKNKLEDRRIQEAMFGTLVKILGLESEVCQEAALHGLGHLRHPKTEEVINSFIKRNRQLTDEQVAYAQACIVGDIM